MFSTTPGVCWKASTWCAGAGDPARGGRSDDDRIEDPLRACIVEGDELVGEPGDRFDLPVPARMLDQVDLARSVFRGRLDEAAHRVQLVIGGKRTFFFPVFLPSSSSSSTTWRKARPGPARCPGSRSASRGTRWRSPCATARSRRRCICPG